MLFCDWIHGDITAQISYTQYGEHLQLTFRVQFNNRFSNNRPEGGAADWWKCEEMIRVQNMIQKLKWGISSCFSNDDGKNWDGWYVYCLSTLDGQIIRPSSSSHSPPHLPSSQINTPVFSSHLLNHNSPVNSFLLLSHFLKQATSI